MIRHLPLASVIGLVGLGCSSTSTTAIGRAATVARVTYLHQGFAAGPDLFTDDGGRVIEERRHEPFGLAIEPADFATRDLNALGKRTEPATGWSDHGARWFAPDSARWLTPDPPVAGPAEHAMAAPWALHPYQYVDQDPVTFWDPDGREPQAVAARREIMEEMLTMQVPAGAARTATMRLAASTAAVDRNTALRIAAGTNVVAYLEDCRHAKDESSLLAARGMSSSEYQALVNPETDKVFISLRKSRGTTQGNVIFGRKDSSVDQWMNIDVHEVNHLVNHDNDSKSLFPRFLGEFGAYSVQPDFRAMPDKERAAAIKAHILTEYPDFKDAAAKLPPFKQFVDHLSGPAQNRNLTNE